MCEYIYILINLLFEKNQKKMWEDAANPKKEHVFQRLFALRIKIFGTFSS